MQKDHPFPLPVSSLPVSLVSGCYRFSSLLIGRGFLAKRLRQHSALLNVQPMGLWWSSLGLWRSEAYRPCPLGASAPPNQCHASLELVLPRPSLTLLWKHCENKVDCSLSKVHKHVKETSTPHTSSQFRPCPSLSVLTLYFIFSISGEGQ